MPLLPVKVHERTLRQIARALIIFGALASIVAIFGCEGGPRSIPRGLRFEVLDGDTIVVRNFGVGSAEATIELVRESEIGGHDSVGSDLTTVIGLFPTEHGGALVAEAMLRVRLFDSAGRFVRSFGGRGTGPGEFLAPIAVLRNSSGLTFVQRLPRGINVHDSLGGLIASFRTPVGPYKQWHVTSAGEILTPISIASRDSAGSPSEETAILRADRNGNSLDTILPRPARFGRALNVRASGNQYSSTVPMSPDFMIEFGAPGAWVYGNSERYEIFVLRIDQKLILIQGDAVAPQVLPEEKTALVQAFAHQRSSEVVVPLDPSVIPDNKPYYRRLSQDVDGRIWVELHMQAEIRTEIGCPLAAPGGSFSSNPRSPSALIANLCPDSQPPRPVTITVEPKAYDVFSEQGLYSGRLLIPKGSSFLAARGEKVWLQELDSNDVPKLVRFRMKFPARART